MKPDEFRSQIRSGPLVLDGGLATTLEAAGYDIGGSLWSARVLRDEPGAVERAHREFVDAGAQVVISASYQVSRRGLIEVGATATDADDLLVRSIERALAAVSGTSALVAASVGPWGATNHDGSEYRGGYDISHSELLAFHRERLEVMVQAHPDLLAIETIPDLDEVVALLEVLDDHRDIAAWLSVTTLDGENTCAGQPLGDVMAAVQESASVVAVGINCSAPLQIEKSLASLRAEGRAGSPPAVVYPNAGQLWDAATETWSGAASSQFPEEWVHSWADGGAELIGGCCGIGPNGVASIANALRSWHSV